jgi:hypothetical protein
VIGEARGPHSDRPVWRRPWSWPRLLALRLLSAREPAIPVAYSLAQPGPLNAELSAAGGSALQPRVFFTASLLCLPEVSLRCWGVQDGLLICAIKL